MRMNVAERVRRVIATTRLAYRVVLAREDDRTPSIEWDAVVVVSLYVDVWDEAPLSTLESRTSVIVGTLGFTLGMVNLLNLLEVSLPS